MKKEKTFVIVGGSQSHVPFIIAARKLGFSTIVFDQSSECVGTKYCDHFYQISTRDHQAITSKCIQINNNFKLFGVMTYSASDESLIAVSSVCSILNLPCFPMESVNKVVDKSLMKKSFLKHGVPVVEGIVTKDPIEAVNFFRKTGVVILKPSIGGRGSKGVVLCDTEDLILDQFQYVSNRSSNFEVIVERYYGGDEYSVDGIVIGDTPIVLSVSSKKNLGRESNFVMSGFITDFMPRDEKKKSIVEQAGIKAALSLGISNSFFSVDIVSNKSEVVVLECGVLLDCKIDRLLYFAGIDIYSLFIRMATRLPSFSPGPVSVPNVALSFIFSKEKGILFRKNKLDRKKTLLEWERSEGDDVRPPKSISDTLGWVISTGESADTAYKYTQEATQQKLYELKI